MLKLSGERLLVFISEKNYVTYQKSLEPWQLISYVPNAI